MQLPHLDDWTFFDRIARSHSLTQAAREWDASTAAVSKRLTALEARVGVQLVRRSTRALSLTEEGQRFAAGAARIVREIRDLDDDLSRDSGLRGAISVHSAIGFGRTHIAPALREMSHLHPDLAVELELSAAPVNIAGTPFDIGIRIGSINDSRMHARLLYRQRRIICAAPSYLARHGAPQQPQDLLDHECIVLRENDGGFALWRFGARGREHTVRVNGRLATNDGDVATAWCREGGGVIMRSQWQVLPLLASGELVQLLSHVPTPEANINAVYDAASVSNRRVHATLDHLQSAIASRLDPIFAGHGVTAS